MPASTVAPSAEPEVKSQPVYAPVSLRSKADSHLFVAEDSATEAVEELRLQVKANSSQLILKSADKLLESLELRGINLSAGSAVYLSGSEAFMWLCERQLMSLGVESEQIQMWAPLSAERRVFCCHCHSYTDGVSFSPMACSGCHRLLEVTDHFSRIHGAYRGIQVNAEDPADIPKPVEFQR